MAKLGFTVDYSRNINEVLDAAGIGWRQPARLGVFASGTHSLTAERVTFDEEVATPRVLGRMKEMGLRAATFYEMAAAAVADPELGRTQPVVALGSCDVNFVGGSASPALVTFDGERQVTMAGFCGAWQKGTEFLAIPADMPAGHGNVSHNHLFPIEQRRSPKLVFAQPPTELTFEVPFDATLPIRDAAKKAKLRVHEYAQDETRFPPGGESGTLTMKIVTFNRLMRKREIIAALAERGLRPAKIRELVALVTAQPDIFTRVETVVLASGANHGVVSFAKQCGLNLTMRGTVTCQMGQRNQYTETEFHRPLNGPPIDGEPQFGGWWETPCADGDYAFGKRGVCGGHKVAYTTITMQDLPNGTQQDEFVSEHASRLYPKECAANELDGLNDFDTSGYFYNGYFRNHYGSVRSDAGIAKVLAAIERK